MASVRCSADWPRAELVEDNAHGLFGRFRGRPLGGFGRFSTLSFHETKNFICGEGGALVVNRSDDVDRAHVMYHKGTNRRDFLLGQVDKYTWQDVGSSFGLSDVLAAFLHGQLAQRSRILEKRRRPFDRYQRLLEPWADLYGLELPGGPRGLRAGVPHVLRAAARPTRPATGCSPSCTTVAYTPRSTTSRCTSSPGGRRFAARHTDCPVTDDISGRILRLPFYTTLDDDDAERVVTELISAVRDEP